MTPEEHATELEWHANAFADAKAAVRRLTKDRKAAIASRDFHLAAIQRLARHDLRKDAEQVEAEARVDAVLAAGPQEPEEMAGDPGELEAYAERPSVGVSRGVGSEYVEAAVAASEPPPPIVHAFMVPTT